MVLQGLRLGLADQHASVRFQSIVALGEVGPAAAPILCQGMSMESDVRNQALLVEALGAMNRTPRRCGCSQAWSPTPNGRSRCAPWPSTALPDSAAATLSVRGWRSCTTRTRREPGSPRLAAAGQGWSPAAQRHGRLFREPKGARPGRCAMSLNVKQPLPAEIRQRVLARLDDSSAEVRQAAVLAAGVLELREAVPRLIRTAGAGQADSDLRTQAISALCMMPDPRAEAIYRQAASDPDPSLRRAGEKALQAIRGQVDSQITLAGGSSARASDIERLRQFALSHLADPAQRGGAFLRKQGDRMRPMSCRGGARSRHLRPGPQRAGFQKRQGSAHSLHAGAFPPGCRRSSAGQKPGRHVDPARVHGPDRVSREAEAARDREKYQADGQRPGQ